jgi:hypothetical protein
MEVRPTSRLRSALAALRRESLDHALAGGADPGSDPLIASQARRLLAPRRRRALARAVRNVLDRAERPPRFGSAVPIARTSVRENRAELEELADRLEGHAPIGVRGLAAAELLLTEGVSPLWISSEPRELHAAVEAALIGCETESPWP